MVPVYLRDDIITATFLMVGGRYLLNADRWTHTIRPYRYSNPVLLFDTIERNLQDITRSLLNLKPAEVNPPLKDTIDIYLQTLEDALIDPLFYHNKLGWFIVNVIRRTGMNLLYQYNRNLRIRHSLKVYRRTIRPTHLVDDLSAFYLNGYFEVASVDFKYLETCNFRSVLRRVPWRRP